MEIKIGLFKARSIFVLKSAFVISLAGFTGIWTGCAKVKLTALQGTSSTVVFGHGDSLLPPPVTKTSKFRLIVVMDQSHSMKFSKCPTDVDSTEPSAQGADCLPAPGNDPTADRWKAARAWLESLVSASHGMEESENFKVAFVPVSGGVMERPNSKAVNPTDSQSFQFLSLKEARNYLNRLEKEHFDEPHFPMAQKSMGSTAPVPTLRRALAIEKAEMQKLSQSDDLDNSVFELAFLTDGMLKPLDAYLKTVKQLANCPLDCQGDADPRPACYSGSDDLGWSAGTPYQFCNITLPNFFVRSWGDPSENTVGGVATVLRQMATAHQYFGGAGILNLHILQIHPERLNESENSNPNLNLFMRLQQDLADLKNVSFGILNQPVPPFSLQPRKADLLTYKIARAYAVNLNAVVDNFGNLMIDSDGDGLSDEKEADWGLNPFQPRSNGRCLDSLTVGYGCDRIKPCDATLDDDGDGLNDCDENAIGSDKLLSDTDQDTLFDYFEAVRAGLSPNKDESGDNKSGDAYSDHQHFRRGVHPQVPLTKARIEDQVDLNLREVGVEEVTSANGVVSLNTRYALDLQRLPLVKTRSVSGIAPMKYRRKGVTREISLLETLGPTDHDEGINQIVFLVQVVAKETSANSYWLIYRQDVDFSEGKMTGTLNLDLSRFTQMTVMP